MRYTDLKSFRESIAKMPEKQISYLIDWWLTHFCPPEGDKDTILVYLRDKEVPRLIEKKLELVEKEY